LSTPGLRGGKNVGVSAKKENQYSIVKEHGRVKNSSVFLLLKSTSSSLPKISKKVYITITNEQRGYVSTPVNN
jgi:hypothetical protein